MLLLRKRWRYAVISTVAILGSVALQLGFKALTHRARPENLIETGYSFPSGHAITAIVFVSLLIYSFRDDFKNKKIRYVLITLASSFFLLVAISRIILHVHWFSDVLAGISLGVFWFVFLVLVERAITGLIPAVKRETKAAEPIIPAIAPAITPSPNPKKKKKS
jgi:undecaprenyl-diphosphatase